MKIVAFRRYILLGACVFAAAAASAQQISPTYEPLAYTSLLTNAPSGSSAPTGWNDCEPSQNVYATTYNGLQVLYVSPTGNDTQYTSGTISNPFQSAKGAMGALNTHGAGQLVCFETGTYQPFIITQSGGGYGTHGTNILRFEVIPGNTATIDLTCKNQTDTICLGGYQTAGITIAPPSKETRVSYVLVSGFYVHGPDDYLSGVNNIFATVLADQFNWYYNASCIAILGNQNGSYFVPGSEADHIYIVANTLEGCSGGGIAANFSDYVTIDGNTVYDTDWYGGYASSAISLYDSVDTYPNDPAYPAHMYKNYVVNNTIFNNFEFEPEGLGSQKGQVTDGEGIIIDTNLNSAAGVAFGPEGTAVCSSPYVGTNCIAPYSGYTLVSNNQLWGNGAAAIQTTLSENVDITFNTTSNNDINYNKNTPAYSEAGRGEIEIYDSLNINVASNFISTSAYDVALDQIYDSTGQALPYVTARSYLLPLISFNDNTAFDSLFKYRSNVFAPSAPIQQTNDNGNQFSFTGGADAYAIDIYGIDYAAGEYAPNYLTVYQNGGLNLAATTDPTIQNSYLWMGLTTDILGVARHATYGVVSGGAFYVPQ